jgi:hypothetical protein
MTYRPDPSVGFHMTVSEIENGYILSVSGGSGAPPRNFFCEAEADIGKRIIALAAERKLKDPDQYELDLEIKAPVFSATSKARLSDTTGIGNSSRLGAETVPVFPTNTAQLKE